MKILTNRLEFAALFKDMGFKKGAEIGVFDGYFSEHLCKNIPGLELFSVDSWTIYPGYRARKFESSMVRAETLARERLAGYNCTLIKKSSEEAVQMFKDEELDFVYIDANHEYKYVKQDIELWAPKVRKGGILAGDDWYVTRSGNMGVVAAVNEFVEAHGYDLNITPYNLRAQKEDDQQSQWWLIK